MSEVDDLLNRIDLEFTALDEKYKKSQVEQVKAYQQRQKKLQQLDKVFESLRDIWRPRLEALVTKFGDRVHVTPRLVPSTREATFEFQSKLARIRLKFSATTDRDITKMIITSDLEIVPVMTQFDAHSELEFPLDAIDRDALARWVDDRIVLFVKTYLSLHEDEFYLKDQMVEDPVAGIRFPKFAAGATLEWKGRTYYFAGEETRREFEQKNAIATK